MQIKFKLFATLMSFLPQGAVKNAVTIDVSAGTTIQSLIDTYHLPAKEVHLVLLNGIYIAMEDRGKEMTEGDTLAIWPPVAGG